MGLRFCALTGEGAAILCRRVFPHPSRRGGACPSRHSVAGGPSFHTVGVGHWPARFLFSGQFRSTHPRPCTLCHGWSEPGAEVKPYQPKFCTAPGPSGPEGMKSGTVFCALELLRKGVGVSPVNGGSGGRSDYGRGRPSEPASGGGLPPLPTRQRRSPRRAKPVRRGAPSRRALQASWSARAGGSGDPPLRGFRRITARQGDGQKRPCGAKPPTGARNRPPAGGRFLTEETEIRGA